LAVSKSSGTTRQLEGLLNDHTTDHMLSWLKASTLRLAG
jgi:hypothetical protein